MIRFFRSEPDAYETARAYIDAALGYPDPDTNTATAIPPAGHLERDSSGMVYLAIAPEFGDIIAIIVSNVAFEEIDVETYRAGVGIDAAFREAATL